MTSAVQVREAIADDARALHELEREIYRDGRWFVGDSAPTEWSLRERIRSSLGNRSLWLVAQVDGQLAGWLELHRFPNRRMEHVATLTIAVGGRFRRRGVASSLLEEAFGWARSVGVSKITLNVRANNRAAISLYERFGFEHEGRERQQIRTDTGFEDNLVMAKFL